MNSAHCGSVTASGVLANGKEVEHEQTQEVVEEMEEEEERNKEKKQTSRKRTWKIREKTKGMRCLHAYPHTCISINN